MGVSLFSSMPAASPPVSRRMPTIGLIVPVFEGWFAGATPRWPDIAAFARVAEEVGIDALWIPDHLLSRDEDDHAFGMWEGWSLLTALAAVTHRVALGSFVSCTSFRNPALLAKMADTVDEISDGRLILGLGAGWYEPEYRAFGYPFDHRTARFAEALAIISGLLRDGQIDFAGTYYEARDCELRPRGPRPNGPPIMIGASDAGPRMLDLTMRYGDGWNAWLHSTRNSLDGLLPLLARVDAACDAAARDAASLERSAAVFVEIGPHEPSMMSALPLTGGVEEIAAGLRAYGDAGVSHVQVWLEPNTLVGIEAFAAVLELLDHGQESVGIATPFPVRD
jgi:alkanesulfonate monooxygenase SsuD/methylene tetrahydromethanopterin reductase-like flavin-dependent oxidoreductase (luciferase family)